MWVYRNLYWCKRRMCPRNELPSTPSVHVDDLPWFWVGADFGDKTETVTDIVNFHVKYGENISPKLLKELTGMDPIAWKYVDSKSLEEVEFPSEGIVIGDGKPVLYFK